MKASVTLSISVVTVTESTGSRSKATLGSKSCSTWGSGWCRWAVGLSSVHTPITLLEDQKPRRHVLARANVPMDADNSPGPDRRSCDDPGADPLGREHPGGPRTQKRSAHRQARDAHVRRSRPHHCSHRRPVGRKTPNGTSVARVWITVAA